MANQVSYRANDCSEVVPALENIIDRCVEQHNPIGFFASLYRLTTIKILNAVENEEFEDNRRMELMDLNFANRYLGAIEAHFNGEKATQAWEATFEAAADPKVTVLQHLFLGMNAHINLDLGVAAAYTCPQDKIFGFANDFNQINGVLESLFDIVCKDLHEIWPPLKIFDKFGKPLENIVLSIGMETERRLAWEKAIVLAQSSEVHYKEAFKEIDFDAFRIGERILHPGFLLKPLFRLVKSEEKGTVSEQIMQFHNTADEIGVI